MIQLKKNKELLFMMLLIIFIIIIIVSRNKDRSFFWKQISTFDNIIYGSMSGFGFNQASEEYPLFVNFYPEQMGQDFNLRSFINRNRYNSNSPTITEGVITNGMKRGLYNSNGLGQINIGSSKNPIILVPDIGATSIFAKWDRKDTADVKSLDAYGTFETENKWTCREIQNNWTKIWFQQDTEGLSRYCWKDNTKVHLDPDSNSISNTAGVKTIVPEFGNIDAEDFKIAHMDSLIETLESVGYMRNSTLFSATYDFRLIFDSKEFERYKNLFVNLVESSVNSNNDGIKDSKAILIGHGLGAVIINLVLVSSSKAWKDKYIKCFISLSGSFGGCPKALRVLLSGETLDTSNTNTSNIETDQKIIKNAISNFTGLYMLLPDENIYKGIPLVKFQKITYSSKDIPELISPEQSKIYEIVKKLKTLSLEAPDVTVYSLNGLNLQTETFYDYNYSLDENPKKSYPFYSTSNANQNVFAYNNRPTITNGDGTLPFNSLQIPLSWSSQQKEKVHFKFYQRAEHVKIMSMFEPLRDIISIISR